MHRAFLTVLLSLALGACARTRGYPADTSCAGAPSHGVFARLETNDWLVSQRADVWKVIEEMPGGAPRHVGFVFGRDYRQEAGGASFRLYTVTTRDRRNEIGHVDQMGRAVRYEPIRGGGVERKDVGQGTLQDSVAAILGTTNRILLEPSSERRLAFEALDTNGSGKLEAKEMAAAGPRVVAADTNHDGFVDFGEFDAIDVL